VLPVFKAELFISAFTWAGVRVGFTDNIKLAVADTSGAAQDVPAWHNIPKLLDLNPAHSTT